MEQSKLLKELMSDKYNYWTYLPNRNTNARVLVKELYNYLIEYGTIKEAFDACGLTQKDIAALLGVTEYQIQNLKRREPKGNAKGFLAPRFINKLLLKPVADKFKLNKEDMVYDFIYDHARSDLSEYITKDCAQYAYDMAKQHVPQMEKPYGREPLLLRLCCSLGKVSCLELLKDLGITITDETDIMLDNKQYTALEIAKKYIEFKHVNDFLSLGEITMSTIDVSEFLKKILLQRNYVDYSFFEEV